MSSMKTQTTVIELESASQNGADVATEVPELQKLDCSQCTGLTKLPDISEEEFKAWYDKNKNSQLNNE